MTNKDLIKQYAQTIGDMNEYQFNHMPGSGKKTYIRQTMLKYKDGVGVIPYYVYNVMDDETKDNVVNLDIKELNNYGISVSHFKNYADPKGGGFYDYIRRMLNNVDSKFINHILDAIRYYGDKTPIEGNRRLIIDILTTRTDINYVGWISILDALWDIKLDVIYLVKLFLNSGGKLGANELSALTMYNMEPMGIVKLLGNDEYKRIITSDKLKSGLDPKRWVSAAWNGVDAGKIIKMMDL